MFSPSKIQGMVWVEAVATSKLLGCSDSPHQRKFCTEGLLGLICYGYAREISIIIIHEETCYLHSVGIENVDDIIIKA